jgi:hypothetical protein
VWTPPETTAGQTSLFCARCGTGLQPGTGNFYRVTIEAVADPAPPLVSAEDVAADLRRQIEALLDQLQGISEQEALDQVYRRLVLHLCVPCYRQWIDHPIG